MRYRFNRRGDVVADTRQAAPTVGTDHYAKGDALFTPRATSPARDRFKAERLARRAAARAAAIAASPAGRMRAVHDAASRSDAA